MSLRLSAVERLAKDPRPAFIVVFRLTPDGQGIVGYLVHLLGPALARVLKRLRAAHANKSWDVNHAKLSFDYRKFGVRFAMTPDGLRQALSDACGTDSAGYVAEKQRQLNELGYENGGLEAEALFWIEGADHLSNILLGLEPIIPKRLRAFDTRFGVRIPYVGPAFNELEELRVEPPHIGGCVVSIRGPGLTPAAVFEADMYVGPPMEGLDAPWLLVRHSDFTLTFKANALNFETTGAFDTKDRSLDGWIQLSRGLVYLAGGEGVVSVAAEPETIPPISLPLGAELDGPFVDQLPEVNRYVEGWRRLLDLAGLPPRGSFSMKDVWAAADVGLAVDLMFGVPPRAWFAFYSQDLGDPPEHVEALYINTCRFADSAVSYSVKVSLQANGASPSEHRSVAFQPLNVRPAVPDLEDYAEDQAAAHGLKVVINPANITQVRWPSI